MEQVAARMPPQRDTVHLDDLIPEGVGLGLLVCGDAFPQRVERVEGRPMIGRSARDAVEQQINVGRVLRRLPTCEGPHLGFPEVSFEGVPLGSDLQGAVTVGLIPPAARQQHRLDQLRVCQRNASDIESPK